MSAIFPSISLDRDALLNELFLPYQVSWILAEDEFHARKQQVRALAEKSVRIGWTFADAFKNVRKRLRFRKRDYLFATKDYPSALEYMRLARDFTELFNFTKAIVSHGEDFLKINRLNPDGRSSVFSDEIKISYIKFDNGSRIIAFSAHPQAMAVYGGDVGLDEFAKHSNAELLWQTAQARVTWNYDIAVWSSHEGEDTLFNQFAQQARACCSTSSITLSNAEIPAPDGQSRCPSRASDGEGRGEEAPAIQHPASSIQYPLSPASGLSTLNCLWNLYYRVTIADAIELGLLDVINRTQDADLKPDQFITDCRSRSGSDEVFQQSYMCNPLGAAAASIVEWSAIERCRQDYEIERVHLEDIDIKRLFGEFNPGAVNAREDKIQDFIRNSFPDLLDPPEEDKKRKHYLGFDVAASGQGDLAAFYIDEFKDAGLKLRALLTVRTEDWNLLKTVLFYFLRKLKRLRAAGDESGLGRQICWEAAQQFSGRFTKVNFASKKSDLGFALMNQLHVAEKRFPRAHQDIAADFFALRKVYTGTRWIFTEGRNTCNPASHCDIAWAGALATHAHAENQGWIGAAVVYDHWDGVNNSNAAAFAKLSPQDQMLWSNDPDIWKRWA